MAQTRLKLIGIIWYLLRLSPHSLLDVANRLLAGCLQAAFTVRHAPHRANQRLDETASCGVTPTPISRKSKAKPLASRLLALRRCDSIVLPRVAGAASAGGVSLWAATVRSGIPGGCPLLRVPHPSPFGGWQWLPMALEEFGGVWRSTSSIYKIAKRSNRQDQTSTFHPLILTCSEAKHILKKPPQFSVPTSSLVSVSF